MTLGQLQEAILRIFKTSVSTEDFYNKSHLVSDHHKNIYPILSHRRGIAPKLIVLVCVCGMGDTYNFVFGGG